MPNTVEDKAIDIATQYLQTRGYSVENVSRGKRRTSEHRGYDLVAQRPGEAPVKIEVKGCTRPWGIPDPYVTEFDSDHRLVADFLYVVYFCDAEPKLCIIPRDALKPEDVVPKSGYRIRSTFKKKSVLERFLQPL
jgi:Protein NO VEIN, C-terminal